MPNIAPDNLPGKKIERLEQALEASQQENERLSNEIGFIIGRFVDFQGDMRSAERRLRSVLDYKEFRRLQNKLEESCNG